MCVTPFSHHLPFFSFFFPYYYEQDFVGPNQLRMMMTCLMTLMLQSSKI